MRRYFIQIEKAARAPALPDLAALAADLIAKTGFLVSFRPENGKLVPILTPTPDNAYLMTDAELVGYIASPGHCPRKLLPGIIQAAVARLAA